MKSSPYLLICLILFSAVSAPAQNDLSAGIKLYNEGNYEQALLFFKDTTRRDASNATAWFYLGLSQVGNNKPKDAEKSLKKSIAINPDNSAAHSALAYSYLMRNKNGDAKEEAAISLQTNKENVDANYVMAVVSSRSGSYDLAYQYAKKIIELKPSFAAAYLIKAECLIGSFLEEPKAKLVPAKRRADLLIEGRSALEKYVSLSPKSKDLTFYTESLNSIKFFADYFVKYDKPPTSVDDDDPPGADTRTIKVLTKPRPAYTDSARYAGVSGSVTLMVHFSEDGKVKDVLVLKGLGFGLDQEAIRAVRKVKFEPARKDGTPVSVVKRVQYNFSLY
jgi:TonB family protein